MVSVYRRPNRDEDVQLLGGSSSTTEKAYNNSEGMDNNTKYGVKKVWNNEKGRRIEKCLNLKDLPNG